LFTQQPKKSAILDCVLPSLSNNKIKIISLTFALSSSFNPHSADIQADLISKKFRIAQTSNDCYAII
jgi:hypothetical protein